MAAKPRAEPKIDAALAMQRIEKIGDHRRGHALEQAILGFDDRHGAALAAHDGGDLEPDITAADNDYAFGGVERHPQFMNIGDGAKRHHIRQRRAGQRQRPRPRAGCNDEIVVRQSRGHRRA